MAGATPRFPGPWDFQLGVPGLPSTAVPRHQPRSSRLAISAGKCYPSRGAAARVLRAGTLGAGPKIDPLSLTAGLLGPGRHGSPGGGLRPRKESRERLLEGRRKARAVLGLGALTAGGEGSNTQSEVPREASSAAVGPGILGRLREGRRGGEVQKRGAGKASGIERTQRGHWRQG